MILSASRRTDLPALYGEWLMGRLRAGFALVPGPRSPHTLRRVTLTPDVVDCIVFWSKNPQPFLRFLPEIERMGYPFYFQFTLNPYNGEVERCLPPLRERLEIFHRLSAQIGPERLVWRYDPVIVAERYPPGWHVEQFDRLCAVLHRDTCRCVFSFFDRYAKDQSGFYEADGASMRTVAQGFSQIAAQYGLPLFACSEPVDLSGYGIQHAACIDAALVEQVIGCPVKDRKDPNQRPLCGCMESVELGSYDSCTNGCVYCYANQGLERARRRLQQNDPRSPLMIGWPDGTEKIVDVPAQSLRLMQTTLF
ncbi:MAG TPA: DUF1848 domain-containing protein [Candidatus Fimivicinus intestinavium]|nr:DUF1848 domain-containing protein [Candidatus Fimivicinus intestinavium]